MQTNRKLYEGSYRTELEQDVTTQSDESANSDANISTTSEDGLNPEESSWKKRYGDARTHINSLTERVKSLETQLLQAQKQEFKFPSTKEELANFSHMYPDVTRHIRSLAMQELLQERENMALETKQVKEDLENIKLERGYALVLSAHPDIEEIKISSQFKEWIALQPEQIQDWCFKSADPNLCIRALDLFKAETNFKQKRGPGRPPKQDGADVLVNTRPTVALTDDSGKRLWKASEIGKLHPKEFAKLEDEIEQARAEGRIDMTA